MRRFERNSLIFITLLYLFLETTSYVETGFLRLVPTIVMILTGAISLFHINKKQSSSLSRVIAVYWIIVGLSAFLIGSYEGGSIVTYLRATYWCSVFFIARDLIGTTIIDNKRIDIYVLVILAVMTLSFILNDRSYSRAEEFIGNNGIYYPLLVLPWVGIISNKTWKWASMAIILLCVLISLKRSATIIISASIIVTYYFDFIHYRKRRAFSTGLLALLVLGLGIAIFYYNSERVNVITERFDSIEEDGGNGRDIIYADVINRFSNEPFSQKLFGRGYNMVRGDSQMRVPVSAHNDFLEVLYDYGYVGILVYVLLHIVLIRRLVLYTKKGFYLTTACWVSYVCFLVMSLVSHLMIYPTYVVLLVSFWAFSENRYRLYQ